jgi:UDP-glucose 4-epimerase
MQPLTWVVGRGLVGRALERAIGPAGLWRSPTFSWNDPDRVAVELRHATRAFLDSTSQRPWQVAWCAGAGVVATPPEALRRETETLSRLLEALGTGSSGGNRGTLFLASSAGGVYGGSVGPPFSEATTPRPISPYGAAKLEQEQRATEWAQGVGANLLVGRLANLYGPGQDLAKPQGLISQLVKAAVRRQPTGIYVSLDTSRDYLFAEDCGGLVAGGLDRLQAMAQLRRGSMTVTKIFASHRPVTVATILAEFRRVFGRPARVILAASPLRVLQVKDLRLRSTTWPELDRRAVTSLAAGIQAVFLDVLRRQQAGQFAGTV